MPKAATSRLTAVYGLLVVKKFTTIPGQGISMKPVEIAPQSRRILFTETVILLWYETNAYKEFETMIDI